MIIFGTRTKSEFSGYFQRHCPACGEETLFGLIATKKKFTLYFVPTFSIGSSAVGVCVRCSEAIEVSGEALDAARRGLMDERQAEACFNRLSARSAPPQPGNRAPVAAPIDTERWTTPRGATPAPTGHEAIADLVAGVTTAHEAIDPITYDRAVVAAEGIREGIEDYVGGLADVPAVKRGPLLSELFGAWLHGYNLGLLRLLYEDAQLGRVPPHDWRVASEGEVHELVHLIRRRPGLNSFIVSPEPWMAVGSLPPFDAMTIWRGLLDVIAPAKTGIAAIELPEASATAASLKINQLVVDGYCMARCALETATMRAYLDGHFAAA